MQTNPNLSKCPTCNKWRNKHRKFNEFNECRGCYKYRLHKQKVIKERERIMQENQFTQMKELNKYKLYVK
jgi:hypothetical protein